MNNRVEGFTFFRSYLGALVEMDDKTKLETLWAIVTYGLDGAESELNSPVSRAIFSIAKPVLDSSRESVLNGKKGGRPKKQDPLPEQENPPFENSETNKNKKENLECELEKECEKESVSADKPRTSTRFVPPSVEEVRAYIEERGSQVDPEKFCDFYASKGWMIGPNKMKDWRAAVRTWEKDSKKDLAEQKPFEYKAGDPKWSL